jgi:dihydroxy-acid dehydratase
LLADLKPSGKYLMEDLHEVGGVPAVMKYLLKEDYSRRLLDRNRKTIAENLEMVPALNDGRRNSRNSKALKATGNIQILFGNLARWLCG